MYIKRRSHTHTHSSCNEGSARKMAPSLRTRYRHLLGPVVDVVLLVVLLPLAWVAATNGSEPYKVYAGVSAVTGMITGVMFLAWASTPVDDIAAITLTALGPPAVLLVTSGVSLFVAPLGADRCSDTGVPDQLEVMKTVLLGLSHIGVVVFDITVLIVAAAKQERGREPATLLRRLLQSSRQPHQQPKSPRKARRAGVLWLAFACLAVVVCIFRMWAVFSHSARQRSSAADECELAVDFAIATMAFSTLHVLVVIGTVVMHAYNVPAVSYESLIADE